MQKDFFAVQQLTLQGQRYDGLKRRRLEKKMVRYRDLLNINVLENNEPFVSVDPKKIPNGYVPAMSDMKSITGTYVLLRQTVYKKLLEAQALVKKYNPNYTLFITYGYRNLKVQTKKFLEQLQKTSECFFPDPVDLYEEVHRFIAVPTVAGHPTGGAVDIIINDGKTNLSLDFGATQYDYSTKNCYVFTDRISKKAENNRLLLRNILMSVGFAPFDGEWWHFCYGDKEWAYYYKKPNAIYSQVDHKNITVISSCPANELMLH